MRRGWFGVQGVPVLCPDVPFPGDRDDVDRLADPRVSISLPTSPSDCKSPISNCRCGLLHQMGRGEGDGINDPRAGHPVHMEEHYMQVRPKSRNYSYDGSHLWK